MDEITRRLIGDNPEIIGIIKEFTARKNITEFQRKEELLCSLYKIIEDHNFDGTEFKPIKSKLKFLLNKTGIRHSLENERYLQPILDKMSKWEKDIL